MLYQSNHSLMELLLYPHLREDDDLCYHNREKDEYERERDKAEDDQSQDGRNDL